MKVQKKKQNPSLLVNSFRVRLRTKNPSARDLRTKLREVFSPVRTLVRLGSLTKLNEVFRPGVRVQEINTIEAIEVSRNKLAMHKAFDKLGVQHARLFRVGEIKNQKDLVFPILAKKIVGQGGEGMKKLDSIADLDKFLRGSTEGYYFEEYFNGAREYRLHVTKNGCFLVWRKLRKNNAKERWYFNNDNCNWISEENKSFDKPGNWDEIVQQSVLALKAVGLDLGAVDVRTQSTEGHKKVKFIILETNSAPALGRVGTDAYLNEIKKLSKNG